MSGSGIGPPPHKGATAGVEERLSRTVDEFYPLAPDWHRNALKDALVAAVREEEPMDDPNPRLAIPGGTKRRIEALEEDLAFLAGYVRREAAGHVTTPEAGRLAGIANRATQTEPDRAKSINESSRGDES